jgi:signal transduction histidine kinase/DNA-binding NarL/FixJ family response regulator/HPt (histidine-containing phosphotransfer) domain-containing protein
MAAGSSIGLAAADLATVFPFHLALDEQLRVVQFGPSLHKVIPELFAGATLNEFAVFEPPLRTDFQSLMSARSNLAVLRTLQLEAQLRGQLLAHDEGRVLLFLCSPWLTSTNALQKLGLHLQDFALQDPTADLLQVLQAQEAILADVRRLVTKLSAQRKEQRSASARMTVLYEVTRLLAEASELEAVALPVLERLGEIMKCPITTLWLHDSPERYVYQHRSATSDEARALVTALRTAPPDHSPDVWLSTSLPSIRCLAPVSEGRSRAALAGGFSVAYQICITGANGPLGAFEVYSPEAPAFERARLDSGVEVSLRVGQFIDKARANQALRDSIQVAAAAAAAKGQFLARMSHEIRTPINGVLGMIELVLSSTLGPRERAQLETARASGELLLGLVTDVLDFSKIEAGHLEIHPVAFDLHACLERAHAVFRGRAEAKRLALRLTIGPAVPQLVLGDELRISQVLVNLLGNAVKFTKEGSIEIAVRVIDDLDDAVMLGVTVADTGIGIPESRREAVFAAFTQAEASTSREFGGTGLGLAISKQLVELMGGELSVTSYVGEGSAFSFTVRLARVAHQELATGDIREAAEAPLGPLHVLVVEDNEINQQVAVGLLERAGHTVEIAATMEAAITRGCEGLFDAILMDVQLPDGDGLTATTAIRNHARRGGRARVPIIGLSAQAVAGDRERALSVGMDDYLTKPVRPAQLMATLAAVAQAPSDDSRGRRATSAALRIIRSELTAARSRSASTLGLQSQPRSGAPLREPAASASGEVAAEAAAVGSEPSHVLPATPSAPASLSAPPPPAIAWSAQDDRGFLHKVEEYGGLGSLIFRVATSLASEAPSILEELRQVYRQGDLRRVMFLSHRLAGSSGTIGFGSMERAARAIEAHARAGAVEKLGGDLEVLAVAVAQLTTFVASEQFARLAREELSASAADR